MRLGEPEVAVRPRGDPVGRLPAVGMVNSVIAPVGGDPTDLVARRLGEPEVAVGPAVMPQGWRPGRVGELGDDAAGVIRPIWLPSASVNQRLPSGPAVIPPAAVRQPIPANSVTRPSAWPARSPLGRAR